MTEYYALLGLGARGKNFRDRHFALPGGRLSWIRWRERAWETGEDRPMLMPIATPEEDEALAALPEEGSEEWLDLSPEAGRFVVEIDDCSPWDDTGLAVAAVGDAVLGLMSFDGALLEEMQMVRLEPGWVGTGEVLVEDLLERDRDLMGFEWAQTLRAAASIDIGRLNAVLASLDRVLSDGDRITHGLFPALVYHHLSVLEYGFGPSDRKDVIDGYHLLPDTPFHRARAEESFHNGWKAIEAVLGGEPSKEEDKLRRRLRERGLDPTSDTAFPAKDGESLVERIRRLHGIRDKSSAHGGRTGVRRSPISYLDPVEVQWVAADLIQALALPDSSAPRS